MVDAVVGAVIMVMATTSLFLAVEVVENSFRDAGRYPINNDEKVLLDRLSRSLREKNPNGNPTNALRLIGDIEEQVIEKLPRQYQ